MRTLFFIQGEYFMDAQSGIVHVGSGTITDRRLSGKDKSIGNRERFLERHKDQIREAVKRAIDSRDIKDIVEGEEIRIPKKDLREPIFGHGQGGRRKAVHPGNKEYVAGDRIARPDGSGKGGGASDSGEGEDDFIFHLSKEEFMKYFFDDLELPNLVRTTIADTPEYKIIRTGFTTDGTPTNLHLVRSMRGALGRGIAFGKLEYQRELAELLDELLNLESICHLQPEGYDAEHKEIEEQIEKLRAKIEAIPFLDPIDLRYRSRVRVPIPTSKAVMFCLMDVSGSMDEERKDLAKRFFILLYLFLTRHYEKIELVFIRHTTEAKEVDEHTFFHDTDNGGTMVSTALELMGKIIHARYANTHEWNVYGAQASDGDNWQKDSPKCVDILAGEILPLVRYFAYIQVAKSEQELWDYYRKIVHPHFAMRKVLERKEIYTVFRDLFKKEE
jgi:uncharacterized sporulation protein YeaH/YhbH (DUF444 family)